MEDLVETKNELVVSEEDQLVTQGNDITDKIINEEDPTELDKLTQLFTINQKKKQLARINKISNLLSSIDDKIIHRVDTYGEAIEDKDLINYWRTAQNVVTGNPDEDNVIPKITINNTQNINVNSSGLNRESRAKVLDAVNQILGSLQSKQSDDIIDIEVEKKDK